MKTEEIKRQTWEGKTIGYSELTQQHLSNIIWFNRIIWGYYDSKLEFNELNARFKGVLLSYKPSRSFKEEILYLRSIGAIQERDVKEIIYFNDKEIGEVVEEYT